jgi:hypothetical protein
MRQGPGDSASCRYHYRKRLCWSTAVLSRSNVHKQVTAKFSSLMHRWGMLRLWTAALHWRRQDKPDKKFTARNDLTPVNARLACGA